MNAATSTSRSAQIRDTSDLEIPDPAPNACTKSSTFRTLVPEVPRFRAVARAMYATTAGEMVRRLAEFLKQKLDTPDPEFSAEMLLSMLAGLDRMKRLFAVGPGAESEAARAARIVDLFLKAHQK